MNKNYGLLNQVDVKLQRKYFNEMVNLRGVFCQYQYPLSNKNYTDQGELRSSYSEPQTVGCIFNKLDQKTTKKMGWNSELDTEATVISVPYDLEDLQVGCLFELPSAFDNSPGRLFRVVEMSAISAYPASISCRVVPEYKSTMSDADTISFTNSNFNLLNEEDEEHEIWE